MPDLSAWNVLVVDDEVHNAGILEHVLRFYNARVRTSNSGMGCLEMLRAEMPTFLLLDIHMPKMSGWDVLREIRADESLKALPVIAVTAHVMPGDRERILEAGFDGYIPKPITPMELVGNIESILAERERSAKSPN
jgi:two-component system, cell cycle response regulator DivK